VTDSSLYKIKNILRIEYVKCHLFKNRKGKYIIFVSHILKTYEGD
jgi:hypothetical protein